MFTAAKWTKAAKTLKPRHIPKDYRQKWTRKKTKITRMYGAKVVWPNER